MTRPWMVALIALWMVVLLLAVLVLGLLRRIGPVLERAERAIRMGEALTHLDGLPPGATVPAFAVVDQTGQQVAFTDVGGPADRVVLFVDANCPACTELASRLAADPSIPVLPLIVITGQDTPVKHYAELSAIGLPVVGQPDGAATAAFHQRVFPYATAVTATGTVIASMVPGTVADLEQLANRLNAHRHGNEGDVNGSAAQHQQ